MAIALIYHQDERDRVENSCRALQASGYELMFAPIGMKVGSIKWKQEINKIFAEVDAFIFFVTAKSVLDEMVAWRVETALSKDKIFIPVILDGKLPPRGHWTTVSEFLMLRQSVVVNGERGVQLDLRRWLPEPSKSLICFLSYSRIDIHFASKLKADLEMKSIRVWKDTDDIPAGSSWDDTIAKAIKECTHFLLLVTQASLNSSIISDELSYAKDNQKIILPLIFENVSLPFRIHRTQSIDFIEDYQKGFECLIRQLKPITVT